MVKSKSKIVKFISAFIWFIFLPNTIYLLTDPINLIRDSRLLSGLYLAVDIVAYATLIPIGVVTYIISMGYFEKLLGKRKNKSTNFFIILFLNVIVSFGLVLGRFQRVNSWEIITDQANVIEKSLGILKSPELILWMLFFTICCQIVYFYFGSFERFRQRIIAAKVL